MRLFCGNRSTPTAHVLVDSGADYALFDASAAPHVGIADYRSGTEADVSGVGQAKCWLHDNLGVALKDPAGNRVALTIRAAFVPNLNIAGVVGREFFFDAFTVTFRESQRQLVLEARDDATNLIPWKDVPIYKAPLPAHRRSRGQNR